MPLTALNILILITKPAKKCATNLNGLAGLVRGELTTKEQPWGPATIDVHNRDIVQGC
jgi:hypothetical protein